MKYSTFEKGLWKIYHYFTKPHKAIPIHYYRQSILFISKNSFTIWSFERFHEVSFIACGNVCFPQQKLVKFLIIYISYHNSNIIAKLRYFSEIEFEYNNIISKVNFTIKAAMGKWIILLHGINEIKLLQLRGCSTLFRRNNKKTVQKGTLRS